MSVAASAPRRARPGAAYRVGALAISIVVHLLTTTAFGYLLGFLLDVGVPRAVDRGGRTSGPATALAIDLALLALFAVPHSVLARLGAKRWIAARVGEALVRPAYNALATLALGTLLWNWRPIPMTVWDAGGAAARGLTALFWSGWLLCAVAVLWTNLWDLTGLRQGWAAFRGRAAPAVGLRTAGPYRLVRHPLYVGFLLALWATPRMSAGHLLFASALSLYVVVAIRFEERDLVRAFGPAYAGYRAGVRALVPIPRRRAR